MGKTVLKITLALAVVAFVHGQARADAVTVDFDALMDGLAGAGSAVTGDFNGNDMLDSDELALVSAILADADSEFHPAMHAAWTQNTAQAVIDITGYGDLWPQWVAAMMTLGDNASVNYIVSFVAYFALHPDPADYDLTQASVVSSGGDPDSDELTNKEEYDAISGTGGPGSEKRAQYLINALPPAAGEEGEGEEGEGEEGEGEEGEGEGEVDCELDTACPVLPAIDIQGGLLYGGLGQNYETKDFDGGGIPDSFDVALLEHALCDASVPFHCAAIAVFDVNKVTAAGGLGATVPDFVAAYGATSTEAAAVLAGVGAPGMQVVTTGAKADLEPFSATGDLDGDGMTNGEEYDYVVGTLGQGRDEYVIAASTWAGNPNLPVAGMVGLALLAGACVLIGKRGVGKK